MTDTVSTAELAALASALTARIGYLDVAVTRWGNGLPVRVADLLAAQVAGEDPTAQWREAVNQAQAAYYGEPAPPQVGAAFVLQWCLAALAVPTAWAATIGPVLPDPTTVTLDLADPGAYTVALEFAPTGALRVDDPEQRLRIARERFDAVARPFAESFRPPEVRMGTGQRFGLLHDAWTMAWESAIRAPAPSLRRGCCMIYILPGAHECSRCPRAARPGVPG